MSVVSSPTVRRSAALLVAAGGLTAVVGVPAASAAPNNQSGLVNVALVNTTAQVPIGVAANVCNVAVNVLASQLANGAAPCTALADPAATVTRPAPGGPNRQNGLVNIYASNTTIQIPVGIAANVCNVGANVLAQALNNGAAACNATGTPTAGA